ncbi:hypothetical protein FIBSPDRAFT_588541 [Athelia psychrophila]|uniref:Uncharacterized protein n=1 Tax=Athelia psychrophila TaxID=1759441 RepID=A0A167T7Q9_9AGAM|nr:hypothetical protein FIBSPDRAFT_588541 [Fibularhizoctonia sp. CBS 109695]
MGWARWVCMITWIYQSRNIHIGIICISLFSSWAPHGATGHPSPWIQQRQNPTRLRFAHYGFRDGITVRDINPCLNFTHLAIASYGSVSFEDVTSSMLVVQSIEEDVSRLMAYAL